MIFTACDLEGVLVPEIWIEVAKRLGVKELMVTTREEKDYDKLMRMRIRILRDNRIRFEDISGIIAGMSLLDGAKDFLDRLRRICPVAIVSDTFSQFFSSGFSQKLGWPLIFCHNLIVRDGYIDGYEMRISDSKKKTVAALHSLNYRVFAFGDSYNDISMIRAADRGCLFRAPIAIRESNPDVFSTDSYDELYRQVELFSEEDF